MAKKNYKIKQVKMASISQGEIPDDVLERIDGNEVLNDMGVVNPSIMASVYPVSKLKQIATHSKDNDTNENTRLRVAQLWSFVKSYDYLMITQ